MPPPKAGLGPMVKDDESPILIMDIDVNTVFFIFDIALIPSDTFEGIST